MLSMGDPNYVYRPWSEERRERARLAALACRGYPPGFTRVYGVVMPEHIAKEIRKDAHAVQRSMGEGREFAIFMLNDYAKFGGLDRPFAEWVDDQDKF